MFMEIVGTPSDANNNYGILLHTPFIFNFNNKSEEKVLKLDLKALFAPSDFFSRQNILTLMQCLWDTYQGNKNLTLQLLMKVDNKLFTNYVSNTFLI